MDGYGFLDARLCVWRRLREREKEREREKGVVEL